MRALVVSEFGGPEVLRVADLPVPEPGPGQVRIRVQATAVHPVDLATRSGALAARLPQRPYHALGWDLAGVVDAVGPSVAGCMEGDAVIGLSDWFETFTGTQVEYVVLDAAAIAPAPPGRTAEEAATLPLGGLTAAQALDALGLAPGRSLAVTGAAGAVGGFAVELAVHSGLSVYAVAGAEDEAFVTGLGAVHVPRTDGPAGALRAAVPGGVDGLLDAAVQGTRVLGAVRDGGRFVALVGPATPAPERGIAVTPCACTATAPGWPPSRAGSRPGPARCTAWPTPRRRTNGSPRAACAAGCC